MLKLCMHVCMYVSQTFTLNLLQFLSKYPCIVFILLPKLLEFNNRSACGRKFFILFMEISEPELKSCLT